MCAGTSPAWSRSLSLPRCGKHWVIRYKGLGVGIEACVTSRVPALAPARAWMRRAAPVGCAALALLAMGAAWPSSAGRAAQRGATPAGHGSLLDSSATMMLPAPPGSWPAQPPGAKPLGKLLHADVLVISRQSLAARSDAAVRRGAGVGGGRLVGRAPVQGHREVVGRAGGG